MRISDIDPHFLSGLSAEARKKIHVMLEPCLDKKFEVKSSKRGKVFG